MSVSVSGFTADFISRCLFGLKLPHPFPYAFFTPAWFISCLPSFKRLESQELPVALLQENWKPLGFIETKLTLVFSVFICFDYQQEKCSFLNLQSAVNTSERHRNWIYLFICFWHCYSYKLYCFLIAFCMEDQNRKENIIKGFKFVTEIKSVACICIYPNLLWW